MIEDQAEYDHARVQLAAQAERLKVYKSQLRASGHTDEEVRRAMEPLICFHLGKREEIEAFEQTQLE